MNVISTMIPYFYYQPTYSHLFVVYSFCRIDDLSWGTKGLTVDAGSNSITSDKAY
jgi:chitin synthase